MKPSPAAHRDALASAAGDNDRARVEFFRLGTHYYIAGRFAALTGLFPVARNLLHHAIEMSLKGALVRLAGLNGIRDLGHDLNHLWSEYKSRVSPADGPSSDGPISELHRFERLRYPDTAIREGMDAALSLFRNQVVDISVPNGPIHRYSLVLEDVDALVKSIFSGAGMNFHFYLQGLRDDAKRFLSKYNRPSLG